MRLYSFISLTSQVICIVLESNNLFSNNSLSVSGKNKTFDICYVNLKRSTERRIYMEKMLKLAKCSYKRINAVDGLALHNKTKTVNDYLNQVGLTTIANLADFTNLDKRLAGVTGCKLSHYIIMRGLENSKSTKPLLVIEDDVDLEENFIEKINQGLREIPDNWDLLLISGNCHWRHNNNLKNSFLTEISFFFETIGMIINGHRSAKKLADILQKKCAADYPIDNCLGDYSDVKHYNAYAFKERLAIQRRDLFVSEISSTQGGVGIYYLRKPLSRLVINKQ